MKKQKRIRKKKFQKKRTNISRTDIVENEFDLKIFENNIPGWGGDLISKKNDKLIIKLKNTCIIDNLGHTFYMWNHFSTVFLTYKVWKCGIT